MGVTTATVLAASAIAGIGSAGYSIYASEKQARKEKTLQRAQRKVQEEQQQKELNTRKDLINQQREQLAGVLGNGYSINKTSLAGRKQSGTGYDLLG